MHFKELQVCSFCLYFQIIGKAIGKPLFYGNQSPKEHTEKLASYGVSQYITEGLSALETLKTHYGASKVTNHVHEVTEKQPKTFEEFAKKNTQA